MALQTKTFTKAGDKGYGLKLVLTENSTSVTANTSSVSYRFYITRGGTGFYASQPFSWNIEIGGQTIAIRDFKFQISMKDPAEQLIKSGTISVTHNSDGSKTMSFDVSTPDASWISPTYGPTAMSMSGSWKLTTIPRASSISAINADIGSDTLITISRASSSFTHTIEYEFGSLSGTVVTKTTKTSVPWTVPTSFYGQIKSAKYGTVTLTCKTYSGSTLVGTKTATFRATASEALCKPDVSGTVVSADELSESLTGGTSKLIRYVSTARATITAVAKNSATIAKRTVNGKALTSTLDFEKVETGNFAFAATDSRGYAASKNVSVDFVSYIPLTLTPIVSRVTPTGDIVTVLVKGNFWEGNFGVVENTLELSVQYKKASESDFGEIISINGASISAGGYSASIDIPKIDYREQYVFRVVAKDATSELTQDVNLSQGIPVFDWGKDDFEFHVLLKAVEAIFSGTVTLSKTTDASGTADNGPALIVGGTRTTAHMEMDSNEILAKSDGVTPAILNLNTNGGLVVVGSGGLQLNGVASDRIIVTTTSGKLRATTNITTTELNYLDGVTSNIQTQLNGKLSGSSAFAKLIYGGTISQNGKKTVNCGFTPQFCTYFMSSANNAAPWVGGAINFGKNGQEFRIYTTGSAYQRFTCSRNGNNVTIKKTGSDTVTLYLYAHR